MPVRIIKRTEHNNTHYIVQKKFLNLFWLDVIFYFGPKNIWGYRFFDLGGEHYYELASVESARYLIKKYNVLSKEPTWFSKKINEVVEEYE